MKTFSKNIFKSIPAIAFISGILFIGSCKKDIGPIISPPLNAPLVSFANEIQPIFTAYCATSGCHDNNTPSAGLELTTGTAWANLVNVDAVIYSGTMRVKPADTDSSVLYHKILDTGTYGGVMPTSGVLSTGDQNLIRRWIEEGALNN